MISKIFAGHEKSFLHSNAPIPMVLSVVKEMNVTCDDISMGIPREVLLPLYMTLGVGHYWNSVSSGSTCPSKQTLVRVQKRLHDS